MNLVEEQDDEFVENTRHALEDSIRRQSERLENMGETIGKCLRLTTEAEGHLISGEDQSRVFEMFSKIKNSSHRINMPVNIKDIKYEGGCNPVLHLSNIQIKLKANTKENSLVEVLCKPSHLKQLFNHSVPIDKIYDWLNGSESWDNITKEERQKFKDGIYQKIYRLNEKIAPLLGCEKFIEGTINEYRFSQEAVSAE